MWDQPRAASVVTGSSEGQTELTAFDRALMNAGIANLNFLRVSSILPANLQVIPVPKIVPGTLVPAVYARISSHTPGERITAALGLGFSHGQYGVIMEYECSGPAAQAEAAARQMVEEAMTVRELRIKEIRVAVKEHVVQRIGCAIAAVVFWP